MSATENRVRALVEEHLGLGRQANLDGGFSDAGVSSVDAVAFMRVVEREFGVAIPPRIVPRSAPSASLSVTSTPRLARPYLKQDRGPVSGAGPGESVTGSAGAPERKVRSWGP